MGSLRTQCRVWVAVLAWMSVAPLAMADNTVLTGAQPSALLSVDQNRTTVIERIVTQWGVPLEQSGVGLTNAQLRTMLQGLRADHLLAASLAGSLTGLRDVLAHSLSSTTTVNSPRLHPKSLGDTSDDLVYTPIVPCRILDTRRGTTPPYNAQLVGGSAFPVAGNLANFAPQGGSATSCGLPSSFAAIAITFTVLNPNFDAFLAASSSSNFATLTQSVVMDFSANRGSANTAIVPVDGAVRFYLGLPASVTTHVIADAAGYLRRPTNYGGTHVITGVNATDSGGFQNTASGDESTVGGGFENTASGFGGAVAGGERNTASGFDSTVAGGAGNTASGTQSTVAGGAGNVASGLNSFAAGNAARADANGCFAFANWANGAFGGCQGLSNIASFQLDHGLSVSYHTRQSTGGGDRFVYIGDLSTGNTTIVAWNGAALTDGGAWTNASDAAKKSDFEQVDTRAILHRVIHLPITTWRYNNEAQAVRHMGPVAQDFHSAFNLGEDDKHITTVDSEGVALAAIQGLHQMMQQKDREIATLKRKLRVIETKLGLN